MLYLVKVIAMNKFKNPKFLKAVFSSIFVFFLFYFSSYFQLIPILIFHIDLEKMSDATRIYLSLFSNIVVLILLTIIYWKQLVLEMRKFKKHLLQNIDVGFRCWFLGLIGMVSANIIITFILKAGGAVNEKMVQNMITTLPFIMLINAGILAPMIEELTFRKAFRNILQKKWVFILSSGIVFGALHVVTSFSSPLELLYIIPYSSLGISFALMYYKTDTIFTSISMHMFHNLVLTILSILS